MLKFFTERKTQSFLDNIRKGDLQAVQDLLKKLEDSNRQDKEGRSGLMVAADSNRKEIVEALISAKADPNLQDNSGRTALMLAAEKGHAEVCKILVRSGCNTQLRDQNGLTAFAIANTKGQAALVREVLSFLRPELKELLEEGPEETNSRTAFQWLKKHEGNQVTVSYTTSKEKFLADSTAWIITPPELQVGAGESVEDTILEYRIGIWEFSPGNFKLPANTACEIEIGEKRMMFTTYYREAAGLKRVASKDESNLWKSYSFIKAG